MQQLLHEVKKSMKRVADTISLLWREQFQLTKLTLTTNIKFKYTSIKVYELHNRYAKKLILWLFWFFWFKYSIFFFCAWMRMHFLMFSLIFFMMIIVGWLVQRNQIVPGSPRESRLYKHFTRASTASIPSTMLEVMGIDIKDNLNLLKVWSLVNITFDQFHLALIFTNDIFVMHISFFELQ